MKFSIEYERMSPAQKLCACWADACEGDPTPPEFIEDMERAGFVATREVTLEDVEGDVFAYERGIVLGGTLWEMTESGQAAFASITYAFAGS